MTTVDAPGLATGLEPSAAAEIPLQADGSPSVSGDSPHFVRAGDAVAPVAVIRVLWIGLTGPVWPRLILSQHASSVYGIESAADTSAAGVERLLLNDPPLLVLAEARWCEQIGGAALRRIRKRQPGVDWMACWDRPSQRWLPVLLNGRIQGAVLRTADDMSLARALDGVTRGEVWLPRGVLQWLYANFVHAHATSALPSAVPALQLGPTGPSPAAGLCADAQLPPFGHSSEATDEISPLLADTWRWDILSARESEAMTLMRQGLSNPKIAQRMNISVNTVKKHLMSAFSKRGIHHRRQLL